LLVCLIYQTFYEPLCKWLLFMDIIYFSYGNVVYSDICAAESTMDTAVCHRFEKESI